ncbi:MAG: bile acid:sodium symporter family protein [Solirubrobacterales bacterium]
MEDSFTTIYLLPIGLAVIMLILGLSLTAADFRRVLTAPRGVGVGLVNLMLVAPLLAFALAEAFSLPAELAVGLVLLGASPGGIMANTLTHLSGGETALSVTMTAVSSTASALTVPLYLALATAHFDAVDLGGVDMGSVVPKVLGITVVPLAVGMAIRHRNPDPVAAADRTLRRVVFAVFAVIVAGAIISEHDTVIDNIAVVGAACLVLNLLAMGISFGASQLARLSSRQATAISLELGIHNSALAITVGAAIDPELVVPAAVYSTFMVLTGSAFARIMLIRNRALDPAESLAG